MRELILSLSALIINIFVILIGSEFRYLYFVLPRPIKVGQKRDVWKHSICHYVTKNLWGRVFDRFQVKRIYHLNILLKFVG